MSAIIARLIASVVLMLSMPVLFVLLLFAASEILRWRDELLVFGAIMLCCIAISVVGWVALWWSQIHWTRGRVLGTVVLVAGLTLLAALIGGMLAASVRFDGTIVGLVFGGTLWGLGWFGLTPMIWKETRAERSARLQHVSRQKGLACPVCGYNLMGLREAKCPECGAAYTLDQLYAAITEDRTSVDGPVTELDQRTASDSRFEPTPTSNA